MIFRKLFKKEINPYDVTDAVTFRNLDKCLTLTVKADAGTLVVGIKHAYEIIATLTDETTDEEKSAAARMFADVLFGQEQSAKICEFYGDPLTVIKACGEYFKRLSKMITKAQKR